MTNGANSIQVMIVTRLMTGFEGCLHSGHWRPSGSPAMAKLIEELAGSADIRVNLVFTRSLLAGRPDQWLKPFHGRSVELQGLATSPLVLCCFITQLSGHRFSTTHFLCREIAHLWRVLTRLRRVRPDVVYFDRSNWFIAAFIARFTSTKVVFRLLGVPPDLNHIFSSWRPFNILLRWAFRSPFNHVVCSMDGSGGGQWMEAALLKNVPRSLLLNGVEPNALARLRYAKPDPQTGPLKLVFLGRIEAIKGIGLFIEALFDWPPEQRKRICPLIVGSGLELDSLRTKVKQRSLEEWIVFAGEVPSDEIPSLLADQDFYLSLNTQGHLSNSTLEAMAAGLGIIVRSVAGEGDANREFDRVLPRDAQIQLDADISASQLTDELLRLSDDSERRRRMRRLAWESVGQSLAGWDLRTKNEMHIIRGVARPHEVT